MPSTELPNWSHLPVRQKLVKTFLLGYCAARSNICRSIADTDYGYCVDYGPGMGRLREHFVIEGMATPGMARFQADEWVTLIGAVQPAASDPGLLEWLADERLMSADLAAIEPQSEPTQVIWLQTEEQIAAFNQAEVFPAFTQCDTGFLFTVPIDGAYAATARYGVADNDTIILDRVGTAPAFRRRGLAAGLVRAIAGHASERGAKRALLISTKEGEALYQRMGFQPLAPVRVFRVNQAANPA